MLFCKHCELCVWGGAQIWEKLSQLHKMGWVCQWGMDIHNRHPKTTHSPGPGKASRPIKLYTNSTHETDDAHSISPPSTHTALSLFKADEMQGNDNGVNSLNVQQQCHWHVSTWHLLQWQEVIIKSIYRQLCIMKLYQYNVSCAETVQAVQVQLRTRSV